MEQKIEVKTFLIQYLCDDCNSNVTQDPVKKPVYTNETMQYHLISIIIKECYDSKLLPRRNCYI